MSFHQYPVTLRFEYSFKVVKQFGITFLSLVINTIVLIHVVVPHHHHGNMPCFKSDIEKNDCTPEHDGLDRHDCASHQHPDKDGSCPFEQVLLLNDQNEKNEYQCDICFHSHSNHLLQAVLLLCNYELYVFEDEKIDENPPYLITYQSIDAGRISGLRAPPVA
ncbi:MAG: hypothetical protein LBJ72_10155 [Dysgonamonadaceae bacterium]|nr:hypothetical protein [Dysgonamonadaceae bacterium]